MDLHFSADHFPRRGGRADHPQRQSRTRPDIRYVEQHPLYAPSRPRPGSPCSLSSTTSSRCMAGSITAGGGRTWPAVARRPVQRRARHVLDGAGACDRSWSRSCTSSACCRACTICANGLWTMGITWGVWTSPAAQRRANYVCGGLRHLCWRRSAWALVGMTRANVDEAKAIEQVRMDEKEAELKQRRRSPEAAQGQSSEQEKPGLEEAAGRRQAGSSHAPRLREQQELRNRSGKGSREMANNG